MATTVQSTVGVWDTSLELIKLAQESNSDPFLWAIQLSASLNSAGVTLPSVELAHLLVSHICWANNVPNTWKFLEKALSLKIVPPLLVLALLSTRAIPSRHLHPAAYGLYMELLRRHISSCASQLHVSNNDKIMKAIDEALHLSDVFGFQASDPAVLVVLFVFSSIWQLVDASLDDEGLLEYTPDKRSRWLTRIHDMEIDDHDPFQEKTNEHQEGTLKMHTFKAIEMIAEYLRNRVTSRILFLVRQNMPSHWRDFVQRLQLLVAKSSALRNLKHTTPQTFAQMVSDTCKVPPWESKTSVQRQFHAVVALGSFVSSAAQCHGASCSSLWLPIDLFLEDAMEGITVTLTCAVDTLTGIVKSLQALHSTTWHDTFLGLWIATLRLVQRERNPCEGPVARLDTCLCMLLSITPLVLVNIIKEEGYYLDTESEFSQKEDRKIPGSRRHELVSSLQLLGEYEGLLTPPLAIASLANQAAAKAIMYLSGLKVSSGYLDSFGINDLSMNSAGNMRHLIVEACIARDLVDNSAYTWPGYVSARVNQIPHSTAAQVTGWSSLMKGSLLTSVMINSLVSSPASSLEEIEKICEIAIVGSDDEKILAAKVLCGASLVRGWNIQEHTVRFILRLLSPPMPAEYSESDNYLISYGPFLNVLLVGISTIDVVQIFSLHGLVPQLAGALMPICEAFGSCSPKVSWSLTTGEELNSHAVFSNAFTLLLKLWSFDHTPVEQAMGDMPSVGPQLSPEYLLLVRNSQLASIGNVAIDQNRNSQRVSKLLSTPPRDPIFMDSFPRLKCWYRQHQASIASPLSGLTPGTPVHQIFEALLNMLFKKMNRLATSGSSSSSSSSAEEAVLLLQLPAWDILEALPFVLDAALTACAHDKLSPRDLATGLKDLADFLPASLASILSYFAAEVTRGVWKPASMNGTDWPSPAANLSMVEQQIQKLLAATGIDVPSLATVGSSIPTLPLPLAALLSLTITYKIDKASERYLNLIGRSVVVLSAGCPWPCMPIIASLWVQKAKRWSDFLIFSASRTVFNHNNDAVFQLLRSCFSSVVGFNPSPGCRNGGLGSLLGHGLGTSSSNGMSPVAPGIFYLRVYPFIRDVGRVTGEILTLLMMSVKDIAGGGLSNHALEKLNKSKFGMRYKQVSLASAMTRVKFAASLGASFVWISGGLNLVQTLIKETLPSWFISSQRSSDHSGGESGGLVPTLSGYALAYFAVLSGLLAWGIDAAPLASRWQPKALTTHLEFMATAIEGKISLGCDWATWRAYVCGFLGLVVRCTPAWLLKVDVHVLKSLSKGLRQWDEEELAVALLGLGGFCAMGSAAELVIQSGSNLGV